MKAKICILLGVMLLALTGSASEQIVSFNTDSAAGWTVTLPDGTTQAAVSESILNAAWGPSANGWIGPTANGNDSSQPGTYYYSYTFDVSVSAPVDSITFSFMGDDFITAMSIDGIEKMSGTTGGFTTPRTFSYLERFSVGTHTITYDVYNYNTGGGTGFSNVTTITVPEPSGIILLGCAGFLALARRRRQGRPGASKPLRA